MKQTWKKLLCLLAAGMMLAGCTTPAQTPAVSEEVNTEPEIEEETAGQKAENGDIVVLVTSDIHCGLNEAFGAVGLAQIRNTLENKGVTTLLVDDGDAIQGDVIGTLTKGKAITTIMNDLHYDVAIPGNHEFDYGMESFLEVADLAEFPYISCNLNREGELLFDPYVIKEVNGKKLAFIGVTTPKTLTSSSPDHFQDENGNFVYDFLQDEDGSRLYGAIQKYVDEVREEGADLVFLMSHLGSEEVNEPFNYMTLVTRVSGIDVILDGHSHDADFETVTDAKGNEVLRLGVGTKLHMIGYVRIDGEDSSLSAGQYTWANEESVAEVLGITNELSEPTEQVYQELEGTMNSVVGHTDVDLIDSDPKILDVTGTPVRIIRTRETNLGDLVADALRSETHAEIALMNAGGLRDDIQAGDITYGDIIRVLPFSNQICVSEVKGQTILDALEWGARAIPEGIGGFLQVSGLTYEVHADRTPLISVDSEGMFVSVDGEYRVQNVMVNGEPLDLKRTYQVAAPNFILKLQGSGFSMFKEEEVIFDEVKMDNQAVIDYIANELGGTVKDGYDEPYGEGRITIIGLED
ncbi:MAG: bifunctional metallophosphatase/5'-nucleotidase [Solobacterium sp.]|nr:bifunctional metallophosphatase/5'-nucleotidase [Solobacterium sp.]